MKTLLKYSLAVLALALFVSPSAKADRDHDRDHKPRKDTPVWAPEIDPSMAFGGFALLGGTLTVLRSRRRK